MDDGRLKGGRLRTDGTGRGAGLRRLIGCLAGCIGVLLAALALTGAAARATPAEHAGHEPAIDLLHASWTAREGAPTAITAITQTPDGWLWIGGKSGLYKFDGVRFRRASGPQAPLHVDISAMGVLRDGRLWVGYLRGGVSLMEGEVLRHHTPGKAGLAPGMVTSAALDANGRLWLGTSRGLFYFDAGWHLAQAALAQAGERVHAIALDRNGVLWVRNEIGLFSLAAGGFRFERKFAAAGYGTLAAHRDGSLWTNIVNRPGLLLVTPPARGAPSRWRVPGMTSFVFDSEGAIWASTGDGVRRSPDAASQRPAQSASVERGLTGSLVAALFEDRENDFWVGTESGLDRFRKPRVQRLALPSYSSFSGRPIAAGPGASVWVDRFAVARPDAALRVLMREGARAVSALHRGADGIVWAAGDANLWALVNGRRRSIPRPPKVPATALVLNMAHDGAGALWVNYGIEGVHAWADGKWSMPAALESLRSPAVLALVADEAGRIWLGFTDGRIVRVNGGKLERLANGAVAPVGRVAQILPAGDAAWIGGENGLAHFDGRRFTRVVGAGGDPFTGITGLVMARDGALWINGIGGVSGIPKEELGRVVRAPDRQIRFERLDYRDGLRGVAGALYPLPSAVASEDGTLWISTLGGVYAFDPRTLPRNRIVPPVLIMGLASGAAAYAPVEGVRLPAGTAMLRIDFTALSFQAPERMMFRYRLDGVDTAWRDGTGERAAYYTNLGPGHYRFHVLASNNDGLWNETEASLGFDIAPQLTQTMWFRALSGLALVAALAGLYAWRAGQLARRYGEKLNERLEERERIARALHDTLLQGMQGLILKFQSVVKRLPREDRTRLGIEAILDQADAVMAQGRAEVMGLRSHVRQDCDLSDALAAYGASLQEAFGPAFALAETGSRRALAGPAAQDIHAIGREAIFNAYRHAGAARIEVELAWIDDAFCLTVRDDGVGMAPQTLQCGRKEDHWGLPGMRERAAGLSGVLALRNLPEQGLEVALRVPAARVYA